MCVLLKDGFLLGVGELNCISLLGLIVKGFYQLLCSQTLRTVSGFLFVYCIFSSISPPKNPLMKLHNTHNYLISLEKNTLPLNFTDLF